MQADFEADARYVEVAFESTPLTPQARVRQDHVLDQFHRRRQSVCRLICACRSVVLQSGERPVVHQGADASKNRNTSSANSHDTHNGVKRKRRRMRRSSFLK